MRTGNILKDLTQKWILNKIINDKVRYRVNQKMTKIISQFQINYQRDHPLWDRAIHLKKINCRICLKNNLFKRRNRVMSWKILATKVLLSLKYFLYISKHRRRRSRWERIVFHLTCPEEVHNNIIQDRINPTK